MSSIQHEQDDIVIRIQRNRISPEALEKLLDWLQLEEIRQQSQLQTEQAEQLTQQIKQATWQALKYYVR